VARAAQQVNSSLPSPPKDSYDLIDPFDLRQAKTLSEWVHEIDEVIAIVSARLEIYLKSQGRPSRRPSCHQPPPSTIILPPHS